MKSLVLTGTLCLSLLSWNCIAQSLSFNIESQQRDQSHSIHPTLYMPLNNPKYQIMSFISINTERDTDQTPDFRHQGYGLGLHYQATSWLNSQLLVQENSTLNNHESKLNIEVGF